MEKEFCLNCVGLVFNHRLDLEKMNSTSPNNRLQKVIKIHIFFCIGFSKSDQHVHGKGLVENEMAAS